MKLAPISALIAWQLAAPSAAQQPAPVASRVEAHLDAPARQLVEGINHFSLDLYQRSVAPEQNLFMSPVSVSAAIGLAYRGARDATAEQLRSVLHYGVSPELYPKADAAIVRSLDIHGDGRELRVANSLWVQQGLPLSPDFVADLATYASAGLQRVDFRGDHEAARLAINQTVATQTGNRITDLLHPDDVTDQTRAALVNTIYWKARWASPFRAASTRTEAFTGLGDIRTPTPLMHQRGDFQVTQRGGVKAIQLPYAVGEVTMVVLLPESPGAIPRLERGLTDADLASRLRELDAAPFRDTVLTLPKMHLEWRGDLVPTLQSLGATLPFGDDANFTGMAIAPGVDGTPGGEKLTIGSIIHQTYLDLDEQGSEATAATAVMDVMVSGLRLGPPPPPPFVFRADHPFVFLLRDRRTGLILFMGRYVVPPRP